jgi:hypothetical protein
MDLIRSAIAKSHIGKYKNIDLDKVPIFAYAPGRLPFTWTKLTSPENGLITHITPDENIYFLLMPKQEWARQNLVKLVNDWEDKFNDRHALFRAETQYPITTSDRNGKVSIDSGTHTPTLRIPTYENYIEEIRKRESLFRCMGSKCAKTDLEKSLEKYRKPLIQKTHPMDLDLFRSVIFDYSWFTGLKQAFDEQPGRV